MVNFLCSNKANDGALFPIFDLHLIKAVSNFGCICFCFLTVINGSCLPIHLQTSSCVFSTISQQEFHQGERLAMLKERRLKFKGPVSCTAVRNLVSVTKYIFDSLFTCFHACRPLLIHVSFLFLC